MSRFNRIILQQISNISHLSQIIHFKPHKLLCFLDVTKTKITKTCFKNIFQDIMFYEKVIVAD